MQLRGSKYGVFTPLWPHRRPGTLLSELIIIRPDMENIEKLQNLHEIFKRYTTLIEPLSLDEAF